MRLKQNSRRIVPVSLTLSLIHIFAWMRSCYFISATGHPALSVPGGFTTTGLPVGLQIVGRYRDELGILQLGHALYTQAGF